MEETIRQVILEALQDATFSIADQQQTAKRIQVTDDVTDLPDALIASLEEI